VADFIWHGNDKFYICAILFYVYIITHIFEKYKLFYNKTLKIYPILLKNLSNTAKFKKLPSNALKFLKNT